SRVVSGGSLAGAHRCRGTWIRGPDAHVSDQVAVMVPVAVVELNKPDAAFGEAAGGQTVRRERAVAWPCPVKVERLFGFIREVTNRRSRDAKQKSWPSVSATMADSSHCLTEVLASRPPGALTPTIAWLDSSCRTAWGRLPGRRRR